MEIADIYTALHTFGPQTISELARSSKVERTRIYRLINELMASGLLEVDSRSSGGILSAAPITNLRILINKREQELQSLHDELGLVEQALGRNQLTSPAARVQFYRGNSGLEQMLWNQTNATAGSEICLIIHPNIQINTGSTFLKRWVNACNTQGLTFKGIGNDMFTKHRSVWFTTDSSEKLASWEYRTVMQNDFPISHSTVIYDQTVGYFNWKNGELFGMEIYNAEVAESQRLQYDMIWEKSTGSKP